MKSMLLTARRFVADEQAAEVTELGIVLALVVAVCVATLALLGPKIKAAYDSLNSSL